MTHPPARPGSLERLRARRHDPPREAQVILPEDPLDALALEPEALGERLEAAIAVRRIGEGLREARRRKGLSTRALAERLHVSQTRVVNVERASETLEVQTVVRFAAQLGYRLAVQFIPEDPNAPAMVVALDAPGPAAHDQSGD